MSRSIYDNAKLEITLLAHYSFSSFSHLHTLMIITLKFTPIAQARVWRIQGFHSILGEFLLKVSNNFLQASLNAILVTLSWCICIKVYIYCIYLCFLKVIVGLRKISSWNWIGTWRSISFSKLCTCSVFDRVKLY